MRALPARVSLPSRSRPRTRRARCRRAMPCMSRTGSAPIWDWARCERFHSRTRAHLWGYAAMTALQSRCLLAAAFAWGFAASAVAQDYPSWRVKILVGFGPGGLGDIVTRAVAQK